MRAARAVVTPRAFHDLIPIIPITYSTTPNPRNQIEPTSITITHLPSVRRNYGEVKCGLMIPTGYIGSQVYMADMMTYYSTLYLQCFTLASGLHFLFHIPLYYLNPHVFPHTSPVFRSN